MYVVDPLVNTEIGSKSTGFPVSQFWSLRRLGGVRPKSPRRHTPICAAGNPRQKELYYYNCAPRRYSLYVDDARAFGAIVDAKRDSMRRKIQGEAV